MLYSKQDMLYYEQEDCGGRPVSEKVAKGKILIWLKQDLHRNCPGNFCLPSYYTSKWKNLSETKQKEVLANCKKMIFFISLHLEAKNWDRKKAKLSKKLNYFFLVNMWKACKTSHVLLLFTSFRFKAKEIWGETGSPWCGRKFSRHFCGCVEKFSSIEMRHRNWFV